VHATPVAVVVNEEVAFDLDQVTKEVDERVSTHA
jgi:hypothetical protein